MGRIWVEDQGFNIVRFNGTYVHPAEGSEFIHFDSWRVNVNNGSWLPAYVYSEESDVLADKTPVALRGQTRLWGYATSQADTGREFKNAFTAIQVDEKAAVSDQVDSIRLWQARRLGSARPKTTTSSAWSRPAS